MPWPPPSGRISTVKPDPAKVRDQLQGLQALRAQYGDVEFCRYMFWILRKKPELGESSPLMLGSWNRRLVPFSPNRIQQHIIKNAKERNIYLKARQAGYTTLLIIWRLLLNAILSPGSGGLLISQNNKYVAEHFRILLRAHKYFAVVNPFDASANEMSFELHNHLLHTTASNRRELVLDMLDSKILCESAEVPEAGQGLTVQNVVASEVARWPGDPEETLANVKEGIPAGGTLDLESTANGLGGFFWKECMRARDESIKVREFKYFFHEWWWHDEYRATKPANIKDEPITRAEQQAIDIAKRRKFTLDLYQIQWRRTKVVQLRHNFAEKYPEDDMSCFLLIGHSYFDREVAAARYRELQSYIPSAIHRDGELVIFHDRLKGRQYVIGADVATGKKVGTDEEEQTDFCAAAVLDVETACQMAALRLRTSPELFAYDLAELGKHYNNALIGVERNADGGSTILTLDTQCQYSNIYQHREWVKKDKKRQIIELPGFPTNAKTRPIALNRLAFSLRTEPELFWDAVFMGEALNFVRDERGHPAAAPGAYDDTVLSNAIAQYVRLVLLGYLDPTASKAERYMRTGGGTEEEAA